MAQDDTPLIYLYIYTKLKERIKFRKVFLKEFYNVIRRYIYNLPKRVGFFVLKEMEQHKLLILTHHHLQLENIPQKRLKKLDSNPLW
jgi:hypothetical protein